MDTMPTWYSILTSAFSTLVHNKLCILILVKPVDLACHTNSCQPSFKQFRKCLQTYLSKKISVFHIDKPKILDIPTLVLFMYSI